MSCLMHEFKEKRLKSFGEMGEKVKFRPFWAILALDFGPFEQFKGRQNL